MKRKFTYWRINILFLLFLIGGAAIIGRLFLIQVAKGEYWQALSQGQHKFYNEILPQRGEIFIREKPNEGDIKPRLIAIATNKDWPKIYLKPNVVEKTQEVTDKLSNLLGLDSEVLAKKLENQDDPYEPLTEKVPEEIAQEIKKLNLKGVEIETGIFREYPLGSLAGHIIGFVGYKGEERVGRYGLEEYYEQILRGEEGFIEGERGLGGITLSFFKDLVKPSRDGSALVLSLDYNIQFMTEKVLAKIIEKWKGDSGTIIVIEPSTGKILALANQPNFDPNRYSEVKDIKVFLNPAVQSIFEPGSIFKPITFASAINEGKIAPHTTYYDEGAVKIGGYTIQNSDGKAHETKTMTQALELSLNLGAIFAEKQLNHEIFLKYLKDFGLSEKTGVDLVGELRGNLSHLEALKDIDFATASFGQGIAVTPIGLTMALGTIASHGKLMRPYVVEKIIHPDGTVEEIQPEVIRQVISPETASRVTAMMVSTVKHGYGKKAAIPGYLVAGKTGTAQVPREDRRGYSEKTIHSFFGFAPAFEPRFAVFIKLDNPKGIRFAADSIAPFFRELGGYILNYYQVPPD